MYQLPAANDAGIELQFWPLPGNTVKPAGTTPVLVTVLATLAKPPAKFTRGLSISPDGRYALYCEDDVDRYEIRVVENFR